VKSELLSPHTPIFSVQALFSHELFPDGFAPERGGKASFIYADYAAATPLFQSSQRILAEAHAQMWGNPASLSHAYGRKLQDILEQSRWDMAQSLSLAGTAQVFFVSSATESNNLLLQGLAPVQKKHRRKIILSPSEHPSLMECARNLEDKGIFDVSYFKLDSHGQIDREDAKRQMDDKTLLVCVMDVNHETGVEQVQLKELVQLAHDQGAFFHLDSSQGLARHSKYLREIPWDSATLSSGKIYGPKGVAALMIRKSSPVMQRIKPTLWGGGQEQGLRPGTLSVPLIKAFAHSLKTLISHEESARMCLTQWEASFWKQVQQFQLPFFKVGREFNAPGLFMFLIKDTNTIKLLEKMPDVGLSTGSACKSKNAGGSQVLTAMGFQPDEAMSGIRVSFGWPSQPEDPEELVRRFQAALELV